MCNSACVQFAESHLSESEVAGKKVLEVGALDVNGSLRKSIETLKPASYTGVDIAPGPGVDEICDVNGLITRYGPESFDLVVSTELMEHVRDWRGAVSNFKSILRSGGKLLITTRSRGFGYHGYPFDFWRYELGDMEALFSDFSIETLKDDPLEPGVFLKATKPTSFSERDLEEYKLYSIIRKKRCSDIDESTFLLFKLRFGAGRILAQVLPLRAKTALREKFSKEKRERQR